MLIVHQLLIHRRRASIFSHKARDYPGFPVLGLKRGITLQTTSSQNFDIVGMLRGGIGFYAFV